MESVTISLERYNELLAKESEVSYGERQLKKLESHIEQLYTLETHHNEFRKRNTVYVKIDRLNLLGLLGLNFKQDKDIDNIVFEFEDRSIFISDGMRTL